MTNVLREVATVQELDTLPDLSVVQFWGPALGDARQLVFQKDGDSWFCPASGEGEGLRSRDMSPKMFPARVLWVGEPLSAEGNREFAEWAANENQG